MSFRSLFRSFLAVALALAAFGARAAFDPVNDDTDIFLANPAFTASRPNVLIVVDNSANWGQNTGFASPWDTKYNGVKNALVAIAQDPTIINDSFNVGLALWAETGGDNNITGGSYIRYGIRQMTGTASDTTSNKGRFVQLVNALDKSTGTGDGTNNTDYSHGMYEFYQYFAGLNSFAGHGKGKSDAGGTVYVTGLATPRVALAGSPLPSGAEVKTSAPAVYTSPIVDGCQKNFIIVISNGNGTDPNSELTAAEAKLASITGTATPATIPLTPGFEAGIWSDEFAKFMANSDCNASFAGVQNVITYTIDVLPDSTGHGPDHTALLKSTAINGKGKYYKVDDVSSTGQLQGFLKSIFQEVQSVNSVFASTTLPVSVNVRGTNLNQVYIGVFRPDPNKSPRWLGNLKLYKLGVDTATQSLFLADASGAAAENAATGFISTNATSFWTAGSTFWSFRGPCPPSATAVCSDAPDGDAVEKGGAAQRLRVSYPGPLVASPDQSLRKLYTCLDTSSTGVCKTTGLSSTAFNSTNVAAADLGAYSTKSVVLLTSAGTTATATVTAHGWASGDVVRVSGATPTNYNLTKAISNVTANTFDYTLDAAPDASRARVTATGHGLADNDVLYLYDYGAGGLGYTAYFVPVTRTGANQFDYSPGIPQTTPTSSFSAYGGRIPAVALGVIGSNTVIVSLPGHGYNIGTTLTGSYLYPTNFSYDWWFAYGDMSVIDANTLEIPTYYSQYGFPGPISAPADAALVTTQIDHSFFTGQTVTFSGSSVSAYNGAHVVTKIDNRRFYFSSTQTTGDSSASSPRTIRAGVTISSITHPTTGNATNKGTATVTTASAHGFAVNQAIEIFGSGASFNTVANCSGYDNNTGTNQLPTWSVQSVSVDGLSFTIFNSNIGTCPASITTSGMLAGSGVNSIQPSRTNVSNMAVLRYLSTASLVSPLTTASGVILAGRPSDTDNTLRDQIIAWVRSADNKDNEDGNGVSTDVRSSVHGDVLHSRPATINYSRYGDDNDVYAYYGSNDGILHAVKGGIAAHTTGPDTALVPGTERWGFIPKEFFSRLQRLRDQTPTISNLNQKDYFFDGSIGVYQKDVTGTGNVAAPGAGTVAGVIGDNSGDKVHIYVSLRRGGNFIYALDVTNPAAPKLLWKKGKGDTGWGEVAQTWSEPKITRVSANIGNLSNPENVVLIFAGGYNDTVEDISPCLLESFTSSQVVQKPIGAGTVTYTSSGNCTISGAGSATSTTFSRGTGINGTGRGILVVDAFSGDVVWQVGPAPAGAANNLTVSAMSCSISSDVTVLDKNRDGIVDRLYVGDSCGKIWRADIANPTIGDWAVTQIANLSGTGSTNINVKRKFQFPPDLVFGTDSGGNYTAVLLGSGDREHPFDTIVQNAFFMVKDRDDPSPPAGIPNSTTKSINTPSSTSTDLPFRTTDLFDATNVIVDGTDPTSLNGWMVFLSGGEKVVGSAVTIGGTTFFNTNQPSSTAGGGACGSNLGIAREYLVGFADAAATVDLQGLGTLSIASRSTIHAGGGYLPSPVPVVVEINGKKYQAVISGTSVRQPPGTTLDARIRTYWYKDLD